MNDIEFIETLKQKRNACDYSQSRLAQELQIIHKYNSEIVRNICFKGGYYEKLTCKKCGKVKNLYW